MNNKKISAVFLCMMIMGLTACGSGEGSSLGIAFSQAEPITIETETVEQSSSDIQGQKEMKTQETQISSVDEQQEEAEQEVLDSEAGIADDEELERNLAAYREAREDAKPISLGNGVTMGGSVNPEEYGISFDASPVGNFDTRELMAAIDTANSYVENTLEISVETRNTTEMCVDPRMWAIYEAEDKGVADGYDSENIYLREYCDNGTWQYIILVREGKGSAWEVIHHGSSYME